MAGKIISGLTLILLGVGFLMKEITGFNFNFYLKNYWPSFLIILGLGELFDKKSSKTGSLFVIIIGAMLQANVLNLIDFNIWQMFFPVLLILFGISLLIPKRYKDKDDHSSQTNYENIKHVSTNYDSEDYIAKTTILSGLNLRNTSNDFKGGILTTILGGIDVDLRGADIKEEGAFLEANAFMGGIDIKVPKHWKVKVSGTPILGAWSNDTYPNNDPNAPVLKIKVFVAFGAIDIK